MDELASQLAGSFQVSNVENNPAAEHPRFAQYKQRDTKSSQIARRDAMLHRQKERRFNAQKHIRCLANNEWDSDTSTGTEEDAATEMDTTSLPTAATPGPQKRGPGRPGRHYQNQLMLSEWLVDVPKDFQEKYYVVPCPTGSRRLVVTSRSRTVAYHKSGRFMGHFPSTLPNGNRQNTGKDVTILDCIYDAANACFHVLDLMCWNGHPVYDSDTDFRFFWLTSQFADNPELCKRSPGNRYPFRRAPYYEVTKLEEILQNIDPQSLDGLLFYHKDAHYFFGNTPLVGWLKPYMVAEMFGISVPRAFMDLAPSSYTGLDSHLPQARKANDVYQRRATNNRQRRHKADKAAKGQTNSNGPSDNSLDLDNSVDLDNAVELEDSLDIDSNVCKATTVERSTVPVQDSEAETSGHMDIEQK